MVGNPAVHAFHPCSYTDCQTVQASQTCDVCQRCLHLCQQGAPSEALHRFCAAHPRHWSDPGRRHAGDQTSVEKPECWRAHSKPAYLVLLSELSSLITHDCDQVFLLFNDGVFICDYYKGLPELCLDIKDTHKGQTWPTLFYIEWKMYVLHLGTNLVNVYFQNLPRKDLYLI